jgi:DNA repair and recombination protein RAD54B
VLPPADERLDPLIVKKLNPHQVVGAEWLLDRMYGKNIPDEGGLHTGAILADEMGLGKTLTSLCVMWSIVNSKTRKCRGIIVAPASLVDNWLHEIKKWIGSTVYPLTIRSGSDVSKVLSAFSHDSLFNKKILVTSYSMYSKFSEELNQIGRLDVLICDEGHRLKNAKGNNLTEALRRCKAKKRMLLSGTPMQNDLEELYAVVNFVCPGYLGSLPDYRAEYSSVIMLGNESSSGDPFKAQGKLASTKLGLRINLILLRRTQDEVLKKLLPPKEEYILFCAMTQLQESEYNTVAAGVLDDSPVLKHEGVVSLNEYDDEAIEDNGKSFAGDVISRIQCLRRVCNTAVDAGNPPTSVENLYKLSNKIQILDTLLSCIPPTDKTVIVSNFTSMLTLVEALCGLRNWLFLRLDGSTPTDKRQNLVDSFNRPSDPHKVFLISSKGRISYSLTHSLTHSPS